MEAAELRQLSSTIAGSIGRPLGDFRQAANENHRSLSKVIKDISGVFASQKKDIAGLADSIQESVDTGRQHAQKADQTNSLIQESITIQSSMAAEIKNMVVGIKNMSNAISFMSSTSNNQSIFGKIFETLSNLSPLGKLALTVGGLVTGGTIASQLMGKQEVQEGSGSGYEQSGLSRQSVADMIRKSAIERGIDPEVAVKVAKSEGLNTYRSSSPGGKWGMQREPSFGPFQLLMGQGTGGPTGLGDRFKAATGIDPSTDRSAASIQKQIDFALDEAKRVGWGQWYGAAASGISQKQGINVDTSGMKVPEIKQTTEAAPPNEQKKQPVIPSMAGGGTLGFGLKGGMSTDQKTSIGAAAPAGKLASLTPTQQSGSYPSGDIIGLGKALQGEGLRVSEHPSFGGVLGKHHGRGHYEGRAIDINMGYGVTESQSPALGARFDALADKLTSLGYKVFWRGKGQGKYGLAGHENHLHAEVPTGGAQVAGQTTGTATDGETPQAAAAQETATAQPEMSAFAKQLSAAAGIISGGMDNDFSALTGAAPAGIMNQFSGGMGGLMGGMGGIGNILSSLVPSLASAVPNITPSPAQMVADTSGTTRNVAMVNQAQVQNQVEDYNTRTAMMESFNDKKKAEEQSVTNVAQEGAPNSWDYNNATDLSWPEWANLGRTGWSEVNKLRLIG